MKVLVTGFEPFGGKRAIQLLRPLKVYQLKSMVLRSVG